MITYILLALGIALLLFLALLGISFYFYVQALKQAHEEGWDMPN